MPGEPFIGVIDGMNLAHAALHTYSKLSYKKRSVAMIFGVPQMLKAYITDKRPHRVVVAWDGEHHPMRHTLCPGYKSHREEHTPEQKERFDRQIRNLRKLLYYLGVPQLYDKKMEGDDMIYHAVTRFQKIAPIRIYSGDKDMVQLLNWDVTIDKTITKDIMTPMFVYTDFGVHVNQWVDYLSLLGDKSDDIPGYPGMGPVNARKFLQQFGSIRNFIKKRAKFGIIKRKKLKQIHKINRQMIDLALFAKKHCPDYKLRYYKNDERPKYNEAAYMEICQKFGLKTMMTPQFIKLFNDLL